MSIYYIDPVNGDDSNDGLYKTEEVAGEGPWKTFYPINHVRGDALLQPGDIVNFKSGTVCKRTDQAFETPSGGQNWQYHWAFKEVSGVTFQSYGGSEPATIDGVGCDALMSSREKFRDENGDLMWDNGYSPSIGDCDGNTYIGLRFYTSLDITWVDNDSYMVGNQTTRPASTTLFQDCVFDSSQMLGRNEDNEGFTWTGDNNIVERCTFIGNRQNRSGIYMGGDDNIIRQNTVKYFYATGIKFNGDRNSCYRNLIIDAGTGILMGYDNNTLNNVYSNIIMYTKDATGYLIAILFTNNGSGTPGVMNTVIANNTVILNGYAADPSANNNPTGIQVSVSAGNNQAKNNIVYAYNFYGSGNRSKHFVYYNNTVPLIDSDYNLFWTRNSFDSRHYQYAVGGAYYASLALYKPIVTPSDANSIEADPMFTNFVDNTEDPSGLTLLEGSNAIDAGEAVTLNNGETLVDYYGNAFTANDIGAITYGGAVPQTLDRDNEQQATLSIQSSNGTVQWYKDGVALAGAQGDTYISPILESGHDSIYYAIVSGSSPDIQSASVRVTKDVSCEGINYQMIV